MSEWVFPVKKAYDYVLSRNPSLAGEVARIKSSTVEDPVYGGTTQYRRARMVRLLRENGWWYEFCQTEWPVGFTTEGEAILAELERHYPEVLKE